MEQQRSTSTIKSYYGDWMKGEGIPIHEAVAGLDDVTELARKPWTRTGGFGAFIEMLGPQQAERGI
jgi:hypothetical protein